MGNGSESNGVIDKINGEINGSAPAVRVVLTILVALLLFSMQYQFVRINARLDGLALDIKALSRNYAELGSPKDPLWGEVTRLRDKLEEHDKIIYGIRWQNVQR